jgi:DNA topoisomerase-1
MEQELDRVEGGDFTWQHVVKDFYGPFKEALDHIDEKKEGLKESLQEEVDIACEKCGRKLIKKWGRNGQFLACPAYPECRYSRPLEDDAAAVKLDQKCPKCGRDMILKTGRYGRFAACEGYPECKYTESYAIGVDCPKENCDGKVVEKVTRRGKVFYGCSNYPDCDFASWDKPIAVECPTCKNPYLVQKSTKSRGNFVKCPECSDEFAEV